MIHLWAFDPGETSGWCHLSVNNEGDECEINLFNSGEADMFQIGNLLVDNLALKTAAMKQEFETVFVLEKFTMNSKITQSPWSLETIGLIRYFGNYYHIPLVFQTPSQAKNLVKNPVLRKAGIYVPGRQHAMDAARHALFYLITKKGLLKDCLKD